MYNKKYILEKKYQNKILVPEDLCIKLFPSFLCFFPFFWPHSLRNLSSPTCVLYSENEES